MTAMRMLVTATIAVGLYFCSATAQIVSFESPAPWLTLRQDSLIVRAQFDTSRLQKKQIKLVISKVNEGKKKTITTKTFTVSSYFQALNCGQARSAIVGGKEFLSLDWSIPELKEVGSIAPFGVVVLPENDSSTMLHAKKLAAGADAKAAIAQASAPALFVTVKEGSFIPYWNETALFLVCKKMTVNNQLQFAFDGKNGKNAFLSFPDRFLSVSLKTDSLFGRYYVRNYQKDTISYGEPGVYTWNNEIKHASDSVVSCVMIPWFDLGVIPTPGRILGLATFFANNNGKILGALPAKANYYIPGTWGSVVLD